VSVEAALAELPIAVDLVPFAVALAPKAAELEPVELEEPPTATPLATPALAALPMATALLKVLVVAEVPMVTWFVPVPTVEAPMEMPVAPALVGRTLLLPILTPVLKRMFCPELKKMSLAPVWFPAARTVVSVGVTTAGLHAIQPLAVVKT
jgi:hypothetical protein